MRRSWLQWYYLATPFFWIIDEFWDVSIRASALDGHPWAKTIYYLFCLLCAYFILKTKWSSWVGLLESMINLVMLFVGFVYPYYHMLGQFDAEVPVQNPLTKAHLINFVLSGTIAIISFYKLPVIRER